MTPGTSITIPNQQVAPTKINPLDLAWVYNFRAAWRDLVADGIDKHDYWPESGPQTKNPERSSNSMEQSEANIKIPMESKLCQCGETFYREADTPNRVWDRKKYCPLHSNMTSIQRVKAGLIPTPNRATLDKLVEDSPQAEKRSDLSITSSKPIAEIGPKPTTLKQPKNAQGFEIRFCQLPGCENEIPIVPNDSLGNYAARRYCCADHAQDGKRLHNKLRKRKTQTPAVSVDVDPAAIARSVWEIHAPVVAAMDLKIGTLDKVQALINQAVVLGVGQCLREVA